MNLRNSRNSSGISGGMESTAVDGSKMSVDEVKETLRQEMVAEFLAINAGMGTGMDTKESLCWEIMVEINTVLIDAGQNAKEYLREEMAAEIKAALMGVGREERGEIANAQDDFQQDLTLSINIPILGAGDVDSGNDFKTDTIGLLYGLSQGSLKEII
jgi:hypothetical protein